jgi:hypothetical protein
MPPLFTISFFRHFIAADYCRHEFSYADFRFLYADAATL